MICDICTNEGSVITKEMQVIFTTEQTEGRSCSPYFSQETIDLCDNCLNTCLSGKYIFADGAMGHNSFYFKK